MNHQTDPAEPAADTATDTAADQVSVLIIDDHPLVCAGVQSELAAHFPQLHLLGAAHSVEAGIAAVQELHPQVVLLDVHLPGGRGGGGAEVAAACRGLPDTKFLALSVSDAAEDVVAVIRAGARGYVTKSITTAALGEAIMQIVAGDAAFSPRLAGFVLDAFGAGSAEVAAADDELDRLSSRELEVMRLIARGYAYKEVAAELYISVKTVETHVSAVLRKLQLSNRYELTRWATDRQLL